MCSTEVDAAFARLAGSDDSGDPDLIEEIDVISWYNIVLAYGDREYNRIAAHACDSQGTDILIALLVLLHSRAIVMARVSVVRLLCKTFYYGNLEAN